MPDQVGHDDGGVSWTVKEPTTRDTTPAVILAHARIQEKHIPLYQPLTPRQNKESLPWTLGSSLEGDGGGGKGCPIGVGHDGRGDVILAQARIQEKQFRFY